MSHEPSEEELRAAFEEQLRQITVQDVLVQTVVTLINLAGRRLGLTADAPERDLEQARLAIEGTRALLPLVPEDAADQLRPALSQVQMAFARESQGGEPPPESEPAPQARETPESSADDAARAKARSKIWTPPGS
jgi:hypothetical protein